MLLRIPVSFSTIQRRQKRTLAKEAGSITGSNGRNVEAEAEVEVGVGVGVEVEVEVARQAGSGV